jgi:hypothetical protein
MSEGELKGKCFTVDQSPILPSSPLDQLIESLARQTQAMLELAESNRLLAESNREMVDYLADQQGEDPGDEAPRRDLAGRPL